MNLICLPLITALKLNLNDLIWKWSYSSEKLNSNQLETECDITKLNTFAVKLHLSLQHLSYIQIELSQCTFSCAISISLATNMRRRTECLTAFTVYDINMISSWQDSSVVFPSPHFMVSFFTHTHWRAGVFLASAGHYPGPDCPWPSISVLLPLLSITSYT